MAQPAGDNKEFWFDMTLVRMLVASLLDSHLNPTYCTCIAVLTESSSTGQPASQPRRSILATGTARAGRGVAKEQAAAAAATIILTWQPFVAAVSALARPNPRLLLRYCNPFGKEYQNALSMLILVWCWASWAGYRYVRWLKLKATNLVNMPNPILQRPRLACAGWLQVPPLADRPGDPFVVPPPAVAEVTQSKPNLGACAVGEIERA